MKHEYITNIFNESIWILSLIVYGICWVFLFCQQQANYRVFDFSISVSLQPFSTFPQPRRGVSGFSNAAFSPDPSKHPERLVDPATQTLKRKLRIFKRARLRARPTDTGVVWSHKRKHENGREQGLLCQVAETTQRN